MSWFTSSRKFGVILLTLPLALTLAGCSYIHRHYVDPCKTRAYVAMNVSDYLKQRFNKNSPVRMAIVPYTVPANLAYTGSQTPGLGTQIAWEVQQEILPTEIVPISEVFNRQDWPGKKDEFFTGNFGALSLARDAGYDLVLVGNVEPTKSLEVLKAYTKIIEVESGITIYYGEATVSTYRPDLEEARASFWLTEHKPSAQYISTLTDGIGRCIVHGMKQAE